MKAIISLQLSDGSWSEVGMNYRRLVQGHTKKKLTTLAEDFANGKPYRMEVWRDSNIYRDPDETLVVSTNKEI